MHRVRDLMANRRNWLVLLIACTLAVRLIVPTGFMPAIEGGRIALRLCPGMAPAPAMAMPGMHHGTDNGGEHGKPEMPCAFAGLGLATLGSVDLTLLVAAVLFAFLLASRAVPQLLPAPPERLRPPLRAPPLLA